MVSDSGATPGAAHLRPLNLPRPVQMITRPPDQLPAILIESGHQLRVEEIQDSWDIDEEWWRDRISRRYYQLVLADGRLITVYQDLIDGSWYRQQY
jgi:hypothetical protein